MARSEKGFTLIELMIVVIIIGIIAAVAIPSYQRNVESTRRTTAQGDLLELAQFMERRYTNGYDYRDAGGNAPTLPFTTMPRQGTGTFNAYCRTEFVSGNRMAPIGWSGTTKYAFI